LPLSPALGFSAVREWITCSALYNGPPQKSSPGKECSFVDVGSPEISSFYSASSTKMAPHVLDRLYVPLLITGMLITGDFILGHLPLQGDALSARDPTFPLNLPSSNYFSDIIPCDDKDAQTLSLQSIKTTNV
jgi:hypothetical protein